jgi:hypothetical protein
MIGAAPTASFYCPTQQLTNRALYEYIIKLDAEVSVFVNSHFRNSAVSQHRRPYVARIVEQIHQFLFHYGVGMCDPIN